MDRQEDELPHDLVEEFTARARVLTDVYRELSEPETARAVITALIGRDAKSYASFLDRLKPDRWPLGRPDLCIRLQDYVKREISSERYEKVWIFRDNLTLWERLKAFSVTRLMRRQGLDTSTRSANVFSAPTGILPLGSRTIVPDGPYQDALKAEGLLEEAYERVQESFEMWFPTGGVIELCLPR